MSRPLLYHHHMVRVRLPLRSSIPIALSCLAVLLITTARIRLLEIPLERDEGEYAYMGQLIRDGIAPYGVAANMKLPGVSLVYALFFSGLGESVQAIHLGLLATCLLTAWMILLIGRQLFNTEAGLIAAATYTVLASGTSVLGLWAHATHFTILPALVGVWLLMRHEGRPGGTDAAIAGLFFGLSILMKQHGAVFAVFGAGYVALRSPTRRVRTLLSLAGGIAAPLLITAALLWQAGVFERFWFWTVKYAAEYTSAVSLHDARTNLIDEAGRIAAQNSAAWLACLAGAVLLILQARKAAGPARFLLSFLLASAVAVSIGGYFRPHYFILLLPAAALCAGALATSAPRWPAWLTAAVLLACIGGQRRVLFSLSPNDVSTATYGESPFVAAAEIGTYLREHSSPEASVLVLGSEPEVMFYARRQAATPYLYMYPLMENHPFAESMQAEFIRTAELKRPDFVLVVNIGTSWLRNERSPGRLFEWWKQYGTAHYEPIGIADILPGLQTVQWDGTAVATSQAHIRILARKD